MKIKGNIYRPSRTRILHEKIHHLQVAQVPFEQLHYQMKPATIHTESKSLDKIERNWPEVK